jgi:hypothetical protein
MFKLRSCCYFIGCPLFGLTIHTTAQGDNPLVRNPSDRWLTAERNLHGERTLWLGQRLCVMFEPRKLRPSSPLFIIE